MSTRAVYSFKDSDGEYHVYKHCDGYPTGAAQWIEKAVQSAWEPPRFDAAEFAASFVAANKSGPGGVYLSEGAQYHGDLEYRYLITLKRNRLHVTAYAVNHNTEAEKSVSKVIYDGPQSQFAAWAEKQP